MRRWAWRPLAILIRIAPRWAIALAEVDEGNPASIAVIERLGMTEFDVVPGLLGPMARYRKTSA